MEKFLEHRDNSPVLWSFVEASEHVLPAFYRHLFRGAHIAVLGSRWKAFARANVAQLVG
jgi:hypothetical protein